MTTEQILLVISQALLTAQQLHDAFVKVNGRAPTLEEWRALHAGIKSPDEIEAEVRARLGAAAGPIEPDPQL